MWFLSLHLFMYCWNFETTPRSSRKYTGTDRYMEWLPKQNTKGLASNRNSEQMGLHQT
jgi:hypothetical protein